MKFKVAFLSIFLLSNFFYNSYAANPAPYTQEAENKIEKAYKQCESLRKEDKDSEEDKRKLIIDKVRSVYETAGYNYDDTIIQVAKDIQTKSQYKIKNITNKSSIFVQIIMGVNMLMSDCKYFKDDCLKYFSTDTANAIKIIIGDSDYSSQTNAVQSNNSNISDGIYWLEVELTRSNSKEKKTAKYMMTLTNDNGIIELMADEDHKFIILGKMENDIFRARQEDDNGGKVDFVGNVQNLKTIKGTLEGSSKDGKNKVTGYFFIHPWTK